MSHARYLGDAVYVSWDGIALVLTTAHHEPEHASQVIYLDLDVVEALAKYVNDLRTSLAAGEKRDQI